MHQASHELAGLQRYLQQYNCFRPLDPQAISAAVAHFRSGSPQHSARAMQDAPHAATVAAAAACIGQRNTGEPALQHAEALVAQLVAAGQLEACANVLLPMVACPAPSRAPPTATQAVHAGPLLAAALQLPGSSLPQLLMAAHLLQLQPGALLTQAPWMTLQGLLARQANPGWNQTGPGPRPELRMLLAALHKAALLAYLRGAGDQQQPPGGRELQQLLAQVPALLRQAGQGPPPGHEVDAVLWELDALAAAQDEDGREAAGIAAAVRAALGHSGTAAAPPGGPRAAAGAGTASAGGAAGSGLAWLYLHDGEQGFRMLGLLFLNGKPGGQAAAQQLLNDGPSWGPTRLSTTLLALLHLAAAADVGSLHPGLEGLEGSGVEGAQEALAVLAPHLGPLLAAADAAAYPRCAKLLAAAGLRLGGRLWAAAGASGTLAPGTSWPSPAQASVRPPAPADSAFPITVQAALHLLKHSCQWQGSFCAAAARSGTSGRPPGGAHTAASWLPILLHTARRTSFTAGCLAATHHALLHWRTRRGAGGHGHQWLSEEDAVACLGADARWWLVVAAALVDQPQVLAAACQRVAAGEAAARPGQQDAELCASLLAAAQRLAQEQQTYAQGCGAGGGGTGHLSKAQDARGEAARLPASLPEVALALLETLQVEQLPVFFAPLEAQAALAWLLDCWREMIEAVPPGGLHGRRAWLARRIMQAAAMVQRVAAELRSRQAPIAASLPASLATLEAVLASLAGQWQDGAAAASGCLLPGQLPRPEEALAVLGWRAARDQAPTDFEGLERWQEMWVEAVALDLATADAAQDAAGAGGAATGGMPQAAFEAWVALLFACRRYALLLNRCSGSLRQRLEAGGRGHVGPSGEAALLLGEHVTEGLLHHGERVLCWPREALVACCERSQGFFEVAAEQYALLCAGLTTATDGLGGPDAMESLLIPETEDMDVFVPGTPSQESTDGLPPAQHPGLHLLPGAHEAQPGGRQQVFGGPLPGQVPGESTQRVWDAGASLAGGDLPSSPPVLWLSDKFRAAVEARLAASATYLAAAVTAQAPPQASPQSTSAPSPYGGQQGVMSVPAQPTRSAHGLEKALAVFAGACLHLPLAASQKLRQELVAQVEAALPGASSGALAAATWRGGCRVAARQMVACLAATGGAGYQQALVALMALMGTPTSDDASAMLSPEEQLAVVACLVCQPAGLDAQSARESAPAINGGHCPVEPPCSPGLGPTLTQEANGAAPVEGGPAEAAAGTNSWRPLGAAALLGGHLEALLGSCLYCPRCRPGQVAKPAGPGQAALGSLRTAHQEPGAEESPLAAWIVRQATSEGAAAMDEPALKLLHWRACSHVKQQVLQALQGAADDEASSTASRAAAGKLLGVLRPTDVQLWLDSPPCSLNAPQACHWITPSTTAADLQAAAQLACLHLQATPPPSGGSAGAQHPTAHMRRQLAALAFLSSSMPCSRFAAEALQALASSCHLCLGAHQLQAWQAAATGVACSASPQCHAALQAAAASLARQLAATVRRAEMQDCGTPATTRALLLPALQHLASLAAASFALASASPHAAAACRLHVPVAAALQCGLQWDGHPVSALAEGEEALLQLLDSCLQALSSMATSCLEAARRLVHDAIPDLAGCHVPALHEAAGVALQQVLSTWGAAALRPGNWHTRQQGVAGRPPPADSQWALLQPRLHRGGAAHVPRLRGGEGTGAAAPRRGDSEGPAWQADGRAPGASEACGSGGLGVQAGHTVQAGQAPEVAAWLAVARAAPAAAAQLLQQHSERAADQWRRPSSDWQLSGR